MWPAPVEASPTVKVELLPRALLTHFDHKRHATTNVELLRLPDLLLLVGVGVVGGAGCSLSDSSVLVLCNSGACTLLRLYDFFLPLLLPPAGDESRFFFAAGSADSFKEECAVENRSRFTHLMIKTVLSDNKTRTVTKSPINDAICFCKIYII